MATESTLSLDGHLANTLRPLVALLPDALAAELKDVLDAASSARQEPEASLSSTRTRTPTIRYSLLAAISKWSKTPAAERALSSYDPHLRVQDYSIVALLAGARTDPNRTYPHVANPSAESTYAAHARELNDRRAVTALANALLSIVGSALATWWAAERLAWRDEWRVLLALSVAIVVASSEAALYLIWQNRRNHAASRPRALRLGRSTLSDMSTSPRQLDKKHDPDPIASVGSREPVVLAATSTHLSDTPHNASALRERAPASASDGTEDANQHNL